eukprot:Em0022g667a
MFTLLQGLWKYFFRKREYFVVIIGLDNAGKTTLLERIKDLFIRNYRGIPVEKITSTVGLNVGKVDIGSSRLILWDLGGQQDLQSLWDKYYAECHGVVYVIDSSDPDSLAISAQIFTALYACEILYGDSLIGLAGPHSIRCSASCVLPGVLLNTAANSTSMPTSSHSAAGSAALQRLVPPGVWSHLAIL